MNLEETFSGLLADLVQSQRIREEADRLADARHHFKPEHRRAGFGELDTDFATII